MYRSWARPRHPRCLTPSRHPQRAPPLLRRPPPRISVRRYWPFTKPRAAGLESRQIHDFFIVNRLGDPYEDELGHMSVRNTFSLSASALENRRWTAEDLDKVMLASWDGQNTEAIAKLASSLIRKDLFLHLLDPLKVVDWWGRIFESGYHQRDMLRDILHTATSYVHRKNYSVDSSGKDMSGNVLVQRIERSLRASQLVTGVSYSYLKFFLPNDPLIKSDAFMQSATEANVGRLILHAVLLNMLETLLPIWSQDRWEKPDRQKFRLGQQDVVRATQFVLEGPPYHHKLGMMFNAILAEAILTIRRDLDAPFPSRARGSSDFEASEAKAHVDCLGRELVPLTILHFPQFSGPSAPVAALNDIGSHLEADVVHIDARSICSLLEIQDPKSGDSPAGSHAENGLMLQYKVAQNSGRMEKPKEGLSAKSTLEDSPMVKRAREVLQLVMPKPSPDDRPGVPAQATGTAVEDESHSSRELGQFPPPDSVPLFSNDQFDVREKMFAGLGLLDDINSHQSDENKRSLLIHIHDAVAISMDSQHGAPALDAIRTFVDRLKAEGRRAVVVATCSSARAPEAYHKQLTHLQTEAGGRHRVITLQNMMPSLCYQDDEDLRHFEALDIRRENMKNIDSAARRMLAKELEMKRFDGKFHASVKDQILGYEKGLDDHVLTPVDIERRARAKIALHQARSRGLNDAPGETAPADSAGLVGRIDEMNRGLLKFRAGEAADAKKPTPPDPFTTIISALTRNPADMFLSSLVRAADLRTTYADIHMPRATIAAARLLTTLALQQPGEFTYGVLAAERIRGLLLYGPPGTGKTLLAKAVAKEARANIIEVAASAIYGKWAGESEKNVRALFDLAKRPALAPLIIFIDEADAMLASREGERTPWRVAVTNMFLREMDGLRENNGAFVMMATNRPHVLDEALLRRLPRKILVELPLQADRAAILGIYLRGETVDGSVSVEELAARTPLYSGSDLKNVVVAAAMAAVRENFEAADAAGAKGALKKRVLSRRHFDAALEEISASVSEDMPGLKAIKKFDEKYGDAGAKRARRKVVGFGDFGEVGDGNVPLVRR